MRLEISDAPAVTIRNGYKKFKASGSKGGISVLDNFSMTVITGTLYGLIGSSGCGKTVLLSCLVGLQKLDKGSLSVFGSKTVPVSPNRWQRMGYMPQETSLYGEFTIFETFTYFGSLFDAGTERMGSKYLIKRIHYLTDLLQLPDAKRVVGTLSGGQKRRVSFAVALINEPELLLLDEPTSGVDPLVRERIWNHLIYLTAKKNTTIILTTHYIDEAKGSHTVGMMREGRLVAEDSPSKLMTYYQVNSLEAVFLQLCKNQVDLSASTASESPVMSTPLTDSNSFNMTSSDKRRNSNFPVSLRIVSSGRRVLALTGKNSKRLFRNYWSLLFLLVIPLVNICATCISFKNPLHDIPFGVVNHEVGGGASKCEYNSSELSQCQSVELSCKFLREIPPDFLDLRTFHSEHSARKSAEKGEIMGYIIISKNYTSGLINRVMAGNTTISENDVETLEPWNSSIITVKMDQTNTFITAAVGFALYAAVESSSKQILKQCDMDERIGEFPLQYFEAPVGEKDGPPSLLGYVLPGMITCTLFFFPVIISVRFVSEKRLGTLERCIAAGTQLWEIVVGQAIPEAVIICLQAITIQVFLLAVYDIGVSPFKEPITAFLILVIALLQGLSSLSFGFILGVLCKEEAHAAMITLSVVLPSLIFNGSMWPVEALPKIFKAVSPFLPMTLANKTLRSLLIRKENLLHPTVWPGFLMSLIYILGGSLLVFILVSRLSFK